MTTELTCGATLPVTDESGEVVAEQAQFYDERGELRHVERRAKPGQYKEGQKYALDPNV